MNVFYRGDGLRNSIREPDEIVIGVTLPPPGPGLRAAYEKLRIRKAIDFPVLSVAVSAVLGAGSRVQAMTVVVSGLSAKPRQVARLDDLILGNPLDAALAAAVGEQVRGQCYPLANLNVDAAWRREVLPVIVRRALLNLVAPG
jgi:CO/xanthine dehydrogenase FAD-binding subunit